jgi:hypothetical protein
MRCPVSKIIKFQPPAIFPQHDLDELVGQTIKVFVEEMDEFIDIFVEDIMLDEDNDVVYITTDREHDAMLELGSAIEYVKELRLRKLENRIKKLEMH